MLATKSPVTKNKIVKKSDPPKITKRNGSITKTSKVHITPKNSNKRKSKKSKDEDSYEDSNESDESDRNEDFNENEDSNCNNDDSIYHM